LKPGIPRRIVSARSTIQGEGPRLASAADGLETCIDAEYERVAEKGTDQRPEDICVQQRAQLLTSLEGFTNTVAAARRQAAQ
jgi:hypothetical protein